MHDNPRRPGEDAEAHSNTQDDARAQHAVLFEALALYPALLTTAELVREISAGSDGFAEVDAIERAIGDLIGAGLLNRTAGLISPTRAALLFHSLDRG